jgi:hypothetical protein
MEGVGEFVVEGPNKPSIPDDRKFQGRNIDLGSPGMERGILRLGESGKAKEEGEQAKEIHTEYQVIARSRGRRGRVSGA